MLETQSSGYSVDGVQIRVQLKCSAGVAQDVAETTMYMHAQSTGEGFEKMWHGYTKYTVWNCGPELLFKLVQAPLWFYPIDTRINLLTRRDTISQLRCLFEPQITTQFALKCLFTLQFSAVSQRS